MWLPRKISSHIARIFSCMCRKVPTHAGRNIHVLTVKFLLDSVMSWTVYIMQVRYRAEAVNSTYTEVQSIVRNASRVVESASQLALELQNRSRQLKYQAMAQEQTSLSHADVR